MALNKYSWSVDVETRSGAFPDMLAEMSRNKELIDEINPIVFKTLQQLKGVKILAPNHKKRLSIFSFYFEKYHFNLVVKLLNDRFGIQTRGGCSCAGTYGHFLLNVNQETSNKIKNQILEGCNTEKPGWVRLSLHPTITNKELTFICNALKELSEKIEVWANDYKYDPSKNDFVHRTIMPAEKQLVNSWFSV